MRWISVTELCLVDLSCPPSLRGRVGQYTVSQGPDLGEAGFEGLFHCSIVGVMWRGAQQPGEAGNFECLYPF